MGDVAEDRRTVARVGDLSGKHCGSAGTFLCIRKRGFAAITCDGDLFGDGDIVIITGETTDVGFTDKSDGVIARLIKRVSKGFSGSAF